MNEHFRITVAGTVVFLVSLLTACAPSTSLSTSDEPTHSGQTLEAEVQESPESSDPETPKASEQEVEAGQDTDLETSAKDKGGKQSNEENDSPERDSDSTISFSEVRANNSRDNCWIVLLGNVYNFTPVVQQHPFGNQLSNAVCGKDATDTFRQNTDINDVVEQLSPLYLGPVR